MKLLLVIVEGQLYLAGIIAIFLGEIVLLLWGLWSRRPLIGLLAVFALVPLMRTTINAIRACFIAIRRPEGIVLDHTRAAPLFAVVDEVGTLVHSPAVDFIFVTGDFNARAATYWTRGHLRRHRALVLGLPVLTTLSVAELRAVIAHELAHHARAHDAFAAWVYRIRRRWFELKTSLDRRLATPLYVYWLVRWYVPRLNRAAAEVSRRQELLADDMAAGVAGTRAAADALIAFEAGAHFAECTHWPAIQNSHEALEKPPAPFSGMLTWDARATSDDVLQEILGEAAEPHGTHPSVSERLARLGEEGRRPPPISGSAGAEILAGELDEIAKRLDKEWLERNGDAWRRRRADFLERQATLEQLAAIAAPSVEDRFTRAAVVETHEGADAALPLYQSAAAEGHAAASLAAGRVLLERMDAAGIALVEQAMARDEGLVPEACRLLADYYWETNQQRAARDCERRARRHATLAWIDETRQGKRQYQ